MSAGVDDLIEQNLLSTINCTVSIECLNCLSAIKHKVELEHCGLKSVPVDSIPDGQYMLNVTLYSSCGERIVLPSFIATVHKLIVQCSVHDSYYNYLCRWETNFYQ